MAMSNSTFHKLCNEFETNLSYNDEFRKYAFSTFPHTIGMYGEDSFSTVDMKSAREFWKKNHGVWYTCTLEVDLSLEARPFEGWKSEKDEADFLKKYRKFLKEQDKQGVGPNTATTIFMRSWLHDPTWTY